MDTAKRSGQGVGAGFPDEFVGLIGVGHFGLGEFFFGSHGVHRTTSGDGIQFGFDQDALLVGQIDNFFGCFFVLFVGQSAAVEVHQVETPGDPLKSRLLGGGMVEVTEDGETGVLAGIFDKRNKVLAAEVFDLAVRGFDDDRGV